MSNPGTPVLIVFAGLPGTGKTTIARELSRRLSALYVRIDAIEQSLRAAGQEVGAMGYVIANAIAAENLRLGRTVVADCVNPVPASREGWRETAKKKRGPTRGNRSRLQRRRRASQESRKPRARPGTAPRWFWTRPPARSIRRSTAS